MQKSSDIQDTDSVQETCSTSNSRCCKSRTKLFVLAILTIVLVCLVAWKRDSWVALITEGKIDDAPTISRPQNLTRVQNVEDGFNPRVVIPRAFPTITEFPIATAKDVTGPKAKFRIRDNELVLGITVGKQSRAYPINMLTGPQREIINDMLGGQAIAATW